MSQRLRELDRQFFYRLCSTVIEVPPLRTRHFCAGVAAPAIRRRAMKSWR
jgi:transcriptional regulator of acetoin/glycerol metabolism